MPHPNNATLQAAHSLLAGLLTALGAQVAGKPGEPLVEHPLFVLGLVVIATAIDALGFAGLLP